jgi:hypothetical protein
MIKPGAIPPMPSGTPPGAGGMPGMGGGGGKNAVAQNLGSPHSGLKSTLTKGDPMSRMMGHYGKGHSFSQTPPVGGDPTMGGPTKAPSIAAIRGGQGGMKANVRQGGLGPGKMSTPGTAQDYSMTSPDME